MAQKQPTPEHCNYSCQSYVGVLFRDRGKAVCAPRNSQESNSGPEPGLEEVCYFVTPRQKCVNNIEQGRIWKPA